MRGKSPFFFDFFLIFFVECYKLLELGFSRI